jgi:hypothetical protein
VESKRGDTCFTELLPLTIAPDAPRRISRRDRFHR